MEYIISVEEVIELENVSLNDIEVELYYEIFQQNQAILQA